MKRPFVKMHGAGNDYIYFDCLHEDLPDPSGLAVRLSDRHKGIRGDGIVLICPSAVPDAKMRMFNADGSEGKMCGNAIRCVGKYLYDHGIARREELHIETLSGVKKLRLNTERDENPLSAATSDSSQRPDFSSRHACRRRNWRIYSAGWQPSIVSKTV